MTLREYSKSTAGENSLYITMATIRTFFVVLCLASILLPRYSDSQLTFSKNWDAPGGKRSPEAPFTLPDLYWKLSGNKICQRLLAEIKQLLDENASPFIPNQTWKK